MGECRYPAGQVCRLGALVGEPEGSALCVIMYSAIDTWGAADIDNPASAVEP